MAAVVASKAAPTSFAEIGMSGLKRQVNTIDEEILRELSGTRAVKVYKEMRDNDAVVSATLYAVEQMLRRVDWTVVPFNDPGQAPLPADRENAEFLESCRQDMSASWEDTMSEILTMLPFGWAWLEVVFKRREGFDQSDGARRSRFDDGRIGWRKLALRSQDSLYGWVFDEIGGLDAMLQQAPPDFEVVEIPIEKSMLFRFKTEKGNPEGRSMLRAAYRSWFFKKRIEEIEGTGIERDLAGLPMLTPEEGLDIWNTEDDEAIAIKTQAEKLIKSIKRDEQEGILKPFGWELELLSSGGARQFDTTKVIMRYNQAIAMTVLADVILLGHESVGSLALSREKGKIFTMGLNAIADAIADVFNRFGVPQLWRLNGLPMDRLATLDHGNVMAPDMEQVSEYVSNVAGAGLLTPNVALERELLRIGNLPEPDEGLEELLERTKMEEEAQSPAREKEMGDELPKDDLPPQRRPAGGGDAKTKKGRGSTT
jgi:hypothetical protein